MRRASDFDVFAHQHPALRVEAGFRLIQHQDLGVMHQRHGQIQAALHPARKRARQFVLFFRQVEILEQVFAALAGIFACQPIHLADELHLFETGQRVPQNNILRTYSHPGADSGIAIRDGFAMDEHLPGIRSEQSAHHVDRGGFPGSVRTEQAEDFPLVDLEGKILDGGQRAVAFGQVPGLENWDGHLRTSKKEIECQPGLSQRDNQRPPQN